MERENSAKSIWSFFKSKKLAALLILILAAVSAVGMFNEMDWIFRTWWFAVIGIIFLINLTACTVQQVATGYRSWKKSQLLIDCDNRVEESTFTDRTYESITSVLLAWRYRAVPDGRGSLWVKGRFGIWGASVFHIGLILITIGGLVSGIMKMEGHLKLGEGEVRYETHRDYYWIEEGPMFGEKYHKEFGLTLEKQHVITDSEGDIDEIISDIAIIEKGEVVKRYSLEQKEPFVHRGLRIYQREPGFAPLVEIDGKNGKPLVKSFVLLETKQTEDKSEFYLNDFPVPGSGYTVNIRFFPDLIQQGSIIATGRYTLSNPGALFTVWEGKQKIAEKVVKPGGVMEFAGYKLRLGEIRHWNGFDVVNDPGAGFVFAGSWIALLGLVIMYLTPYKKIQIVFSKDRGIKLLGVSNRNRKIFEEEMAEIQAKAAMGTTKRE